MSIWKQLLSIFLAFGCISSAYAAAAPDGTSQEVQGAESGTCDTGANRRKINKNKTSEDCLMAKCAALFRATQSGNENAVRALLQEDAFLANIPNKRGETPLIVAAKYGHINTTIILISFGADPKIADQSGHNALDYAHYYCFGTSDFTILQIIERANKGPITKESKEGAWD